MLSEHKGGGLTRIEKKAAITERLKNILWDDELAGDFLSASRLMPTEAAVSRYCCPSPRVIAPEMRKVELGLASVEAKLKERGIQALLPPQSIDVGGEAPKLADAHAPLDAAVLSRKAMGNVITDLDGTPTRPPEFRALTLAEMRANPPKPRGMVMAPWLPEAGLAMLFGDRGSGKTFLALAIAYAIANGEDLLGWTVKEPRSVCYIDGEMSEADTMQRMEAAVRLLPADHSSQGVVRLLSMDRAGLDLDLSDPIHQTWVDAELGDAKVVIIDNLATTVSASDDRSEAARWDSVQRWFLKHRREGRTVLLIHHVTKEGKQRGLHAKEDVLDSVLRIESRNFEGSSEPARIRLAFTKRRGFHGDDARTFKADLTEGGWERLGPSDRADTSENQKPSKRQTEPPAIVALRAAVSLEKIVPPASANLPAGTIGATLNGWKEQISVLEPNITPATLRKRISRANSLAVQRDGDVVWLRPAD